MNKNRIRKTLYASILTCMMCMLTPSAWSQDTLRVFGTQIDTTKVYDGNDTAHVSQIGTYLPSLGNQVYVTAVAIYNDASVGDNKPVTVSFTLSGPDAVNYYAPADILLYADITPRPLNASGVVTASSKIYDGTTNCPVISEGTLNGILPNDTVEQIVTAEFANPNASQLIQPVTVSHTLTGPQAGNYTVIDAGIHLASIAPCPVTAQPLMINKVKEYDGTDTATVTNTPIPSPVFNDDDLHILTTATYDSPEVGEHKTITAHFVLQGLSATNYTIDPDSVYSTEGKIILPTILDSSSSNQHPLIPSAQGYCIGQQVSIRYHIRQGSPIRYRLIFSAEELVLGFENSAWTPCTATDSVITFSLPTNCPHGTYPFTVEFLNEANVVHSVYGSFTVDIPNSYLVQPFDDVISFDNSGSLDIPAGQYSSYQWMHNGEPIPGATKPYYQEIGGLYGVYSLILNPGKDDQAKVCPSINYTSDNTKAEIILFPSPVTVSTTIRLKGFEDALHTLQVFNSHGEQVHIATFEGVRHQLDLSFLPQGTYIITIDGHSAKTLKL